MRARPRTIAAMALSGAVAGCVIFACYTPTAMTVTITTDVECRAGGALAPRTALYVGPSMIGLEPSADTFDCSPGTPSAIGSIVFAPDDHASEPRITVHVAMNTTGAGTAPCRQPGPTLPTSCIVARRSFKFREHDSRRLSVHLDKRCAGKFCDETRTCTVLAGGVPDCTPADVDDPAFVGDSDAAADAAIDGDGAFVPNDAPGDAPNGGALCNAGGGVLARNLVAARHIAVNGTNVFYTQTAGDGHVDVLSIPKNGAGTPTIEWSTSIGNTVTALAVDDAVLWVGTEDTITRKLFSGGGSSQAIGTVVSIALHEGVAYFLAQGGAHLRRMGTTGAAEEINDVAGPVTGDAVAAAGDGVGKPGRLFVLDNAGNRIKNYPLPWTVTPMPTVASFAGGGSVGTSIAAARNGTRFEAFVTFPPQTIGWTMQTLSSVSQFADDTQQPRGIVADGTGTFHIVGVQNEGAIRRTLLGPPSAPTLTPSVPLEPTKDFDIQGLAIDADCVYFSARKAIGDLYELRVRRKTPTP